MNWLFNNLDVIGSAIVAHLATALPAIVLSFVLSIPIGWLANRFRWSRGFLLTVCALLYAIPSLPLFILLPLVIGTGLRDSINVVISMTIYGIALMARSTADGLASVDADVRQSATAMGFSPWSRFWRVELPLAGPVLLAGLRVVSVSTISLTTVGAVLGIESLGSLFTDGFQRNIPLEILTGIVLTIAMALVIDLLIVLLGRALMPWTRPVSAHSRAIRAARDAVVA
ncbi:MAG: osmoprotectant transport system permease protein [Microbacteriaceae bacterium]|nr:osmoprotectant transport system permease protein [Microbacteriaceae bacterium]